MGLSFGGGLNGLSGLFGQGSNFQQPFADNINIGVGQGFGGQGFGGQMGLNNLGFGGFGMGTNGPGFGGGFGGFGGGYGQDMFRLIGGLMSGFPGFSGAGFPGFQLNHPLSGTPAASAGPPQTQQGQLGQGGVFGIPSLGAGAIPSLGSNPVGTPLSGTPVASAGPPQFGPGNTPVSGTPAMSTVAQLGGTAGTGGPQGGQRFGAQFTNPFGLFGAGFPGLPMMGGF